jgi:hypothetical protein
MPMSTTKRKDLIRSSEIYPTEYTQNQPLRDHPLIDVGLFTSGHYATDHGMEGVEMYQMFPLFLVAI